MFFRLSGKTSCQPPNSGWFCWAQGRFWQWTGYIVWHIWSQSIFWTLVAALLIVAAIVYAVVLLYAFPLLARFENTTFGILKTAMLVGLRYLVCTLLMAGIYFLMGWVVVNLFTPAFLNWGLAAARCSVLSCWSLCSTPLAATRTPALAAQDAESKEDGENKNAADE